MQQDKKYLSMLKSLQELGVGIAIDDFGTGYSSLQRLQTLPINTLKIDRCFIKDINQQQSHKIILNAILQLGTDLDLQVIAEGIETEDQLTFLIERGCPNGQGYLFSEPLTAIEAKSFLQQTLTKTF